MSNALATSTSPYLRQHRDNPVDWQLWGAGVFARAEAENKPILLSIGYAACHWCHVMAHESFEDDATARLMNENFVCVKVDREERPDLDMVYQSALSAFESQGGWPLTMFLATDGVPFWGGTYFPPQPRWGKPSFEQVLRSISQAYRDSPAKVRQSTKEMSRALKALGEPATQGAGNPITTASLDAAATAVLDVMDPINGGLKGAPKFPQLTALEALWRGYLRTGVGAMRHAVTLGLDRMSQGGLYDHLGGGYSRYCVDEVWLVPHFEKMLYDNASFLDLLTTVWRSTKSELYAARIRETVAWLLRDMRTPDNAFVASFDADSEGEEGVYYVWTESEIDQLLGPDAAAFKTVYGVTAAGNWEGHVILNRLARPALGTGEQEKALGRSRAKLLAVRAKRVPPERDEKVLADWNGLAIAALVNAAVSFADSNWLSAAEKAFAAVARIHSDGDKLHHSSFAGTAGAQGFLDDYANMTRAALALYEATGTASYLAKARAWAAVIERDFASADKAGYFYAPKDADKQLLVRPRHAHDGPQPSGNGTTAAVFGRLAAHTGDAATRERAAAIISTFGGLAAKHPVSFATILNSFESITSAQQVVVVTGNSNDAMIATAWAAPRPDRIVQVVAPGTKLPASHPAAGKEAMNGRPTTYVCVGTRCSLPVQSAADLAALLKAPQ